MINALNIDTGLYRMTLRARLRQFTLILEKLAELPSRGAVPFALKVFAGILP